MMLIFHIFSYFRFKKKYCIIGKSLFIIKMKNAIYNLKKINVCDLRWNKLAELLYPVPTIEEQNAIVEHIDNIIEQTDALIAEKKVQLETLEQYKKSLIYEYVTGKKQVKENA